MKEVKILGAGLAGLTAAINLAKNGYETRVFERAKDCGTRFGGDLQGLENWTTAMDVLEELKSANVGINFDCDPFNGIVLTNGEISRRVNFKEPAFYLVRRGTMEGSIDQGLKSQALKSGVRIAFNARLEEKEVDIVATGPRTQQIFGAVDKGLVFETDMEDTAVALINNDAAYKGYSYLLVARGHGCLCSAVVDEPDKLNSCFANTLRIFKRDYGLVVRRPHAVTGIGAFSVRDRFKLGGRLYVGEAGGIQEILLGFGMRSAIYSGYLAAKSIIEGRDYGVMARNRFGNYLKASVVNRYLWERLGKDDYVRVIEKAGKADDGRRFLSRAYSFDVAHRVLYPFALRAMRRRYPAI